MTRAIAILIVGTMAATASAQLVYEPVRYQYGKYNEVFYGGRNPMFENNAYMYMPPALRAPANAAAVGGLFEGRNVPFGVQTSPPISTDTTRTNVNFQPLVYSDYLPLHEAGQYGYSVNNARNEAYGNVPRIQYGYFNFPQVPAPVEESTSPVAVNTTPVNPKNQAVPLLNWARAERGRNKALYEAIVTEARRLDPEATAGMERETASEK